MAVNGEHRSDNTGAHIVDTRDVPGKEREKTGMGKKLDRTLFFPFPFLYSLTTFFSRFCRKSSKTGEKRAGTVKKRLERCGTAKNGRSTPFKMSNLARFSFLCLLRPVFAPVPTRFLPRFKPVLVPFLYYLAIISRCALVAAQPLDHVGSSPVRGPVGGLYSWRGDARDRFARYVCSHAWEQAK